MHDLQASEGCPKESSPKACQSRDEAEGIMLSWSSVLLRLLRLSSPLGMLCTRACIFIRKEKKLLSLPEFHLSMLQHTVTSMDKISTLKSCFSLTAADNLHVRFGAGLPRQLFCCLILKQGARKECQKEKSLIGLELPSDFSM